MILFKPDQSKLQINRFIKHLNQHNPFIKQFDPPIQSNQAGPLNGLTVSIKDIFLVKDETNTCASKFLKDLDFKPTYHSTVVSLLKKSGIKILGKTNMHEFSMGPGGSSVGLKPSYGVISCYGTIQYSHSLDCVGLFPKSIDLIDKLFKSLVGFDKRDPTSADLKSNPETKTTIEDLSKLRIGNAIEYCTTDLQPELFQRLQQVASSLKSRGATLVSVSVPSTSSSLGVTSAYTGNGIPSVRFDFVRDSSPSSTYITFTESTV
ncbi:uncharacterized protein MELLADRAFT_85614 [Melampsora larici-populina 98AG31]|uniref:Amidase domain-containing protein n=1 Tax=Melampsora larici-populina (strain 98AG31 / pathotype 3-4-7) TaxID=747676 RepID=F4SDB9_MELLP|nr:uncharacterized protein MELLADRAFT_85614 [Melampsora larici-populina 98AG31]EGF97358.1 hypothetical protein MELLADRAFT_85614 [Melampsora larici-populina 98AG31]